MAVLPQTLAASARIAPRANYRGVTAADLYVVLGANLVLITGMWIRHGGLDQLGDPAGVLTAAGQLAALYGAFGALLQLVLMARSPWLSGVFGPDRLNGAHRWIGFATVWLIVGHAIFTTSGWALSAGQPIVAELVSMVTTLPFVLMSVASLGLFLAVALTSIRAARRSLSYEAWHGIHLYAYIAIALGFGHQLLVGADFVDDPMARWYWIGLYVVAITAVAIFRFGRPIAMSLRHRFEVANVIEEAPGVASIYLTGRDLDRFAITAGQFVNVRFLTREGWWRGHPFSISAHPNGQWLRITVKDLGDDTRRYLTMPKGTRAFIEGPYGIMTADRAGDRPILLVAGGIGVTPLRALLEQFAMVGRQVTLLYFTGARTDIVFGRELDALGRMPGVTVRYFAGPHDRRAMSSGTLVADTIEQLVPDIGARAVYLCGPGGLMRTVRRALDQLGVARAQVHSESFQT